MKDERMSAFMFDADANMFGVLRDALCAHEFVHAGASDCDPSVASMNTSLHSEMEVAASVLEELQWASSQMLKIIVAICSGESRWGVAADANTNAGEEIAGSGDVDDASFPAFGGFLAAPCAAALEKSQLVNALVSCSSATEHQDCQLTCLDCLFSICCMTESARRLASEAGAIEHLVSVLSDSAHPVARAIAASCFAPLSRSYFAKMAAPENNVPLVCADRLAIDTSVTVRLACMEALRAIAIAHPPSADFLASHSSFWQCLERRLLYEPYSDESEFSLSLLAALIKRCAPDIGNVMFEKRWFLQLLDSSLNIAAPGAERCLKIALYLLIFTSPTKNVARLLFSRSSTLSLLFDLLQQNPEVFSSQWLAALIVSIGLLQDPFCRSLVRKQMASLHSWSSLIRVGLLKSIARFPSPFMRSLTVQDVFGAPVRPSAGTCREYFRVQNSFWKRNRQSDGCVEKDVDQTDVDQDMDDAASTAGSRPRSYSRRGPSAPNMETLSIADADGSEVTSPNSSGLRPSNSSQEDYVEYMKGCLLHAVQQSFPVRKSGVRPQQSASSTASPSRQRPGSARPGSPKKSEKAANSQSPANGERNVSQPQSGIVLVRADASPVQNGASPSSPTRKMSPRGRNRSPSPRRRRPVGSPALGQSPALMYYSRGADGFYRRPPSGRRFPRPDHPSEPTPLVPLKLASIHPKKKAPEDSLLEQVREVLAFQVPVSTIDRDMLVSTAHGRLRKAQLFVKRASVTAPVNDKPRRKSCHDASVRVNQYAKALDHVLSIFQKYSAESVRKAIVMLLPADAELSERNLEIVSKLLVENEEDLFSSPGNDSNPEPQTVPDSPVPSASDDVPDEAVPISQPVPTSQPDAVPVQETPGSAPHPDPESNPEVVPDHHGESASTAESDGWEETQTSSLVVS